MLQLLLKMKFIKDYFVVKVNLKKSLPDAVNKSSEF